MQLRKKQDVRQRQKQLQQQKKLQDRKPRKRLHRSRKIRKISMMRILMKKIRKRFLRMVSIQKMMDTQRMRILTVKTLLMTKIPAAAMTRVHLTAVMG